MNRIVFIFLSLSLFFYTANCVLGVDLAGAFQTSTFQCLKNAGYHYSIIRAFHSTGSIDKTAVQSLTNAKSVGLETDIYMFPCRGKAASAQVD